MFTFHYYNTHCPGVRFLFLKQKETFWKSILKKDWNSCSLYLRRFRIKRNWIYDIMQNEGKNVWLSSKQTGQYFLFSFFVTKGYDVIRHSTSLGNFVNHLISGYFIQSLTHSIGLWHWNRNRTLNQIFFLSVLAISKNFTLLVHPQETGRVTTLIKCFGVLLLDYEES